MSTDILSFENGKQDLQMQGLMLYIEITVPMTVLTFFVWIIIYRCVTKENRSLADDEVAEEGFKAE